MPNNDYILRSDAVEAMMTCRSLTGVAKLEAVNHIMPIPAADVEPVRHGRWMSIYEDPDALYCSECRRLCFRRFVSNYCPHCGAKMDADPPKEAAQ